MADFTSGATNLATDSTWSAAGDIIYASADDTGAVLSIGSTNAVLQVTCGLPAWNTCVTLAGNLTVQGTTTTIESTVTTIVDPLVIYSQGTTGTPTKDSGFVVERGCSANVAFLWDESADEFAVVGCTSETGTTAGNVTITAYGNLHAADVIVGSNIELGHACDTTLARASSGDVNIQGNIIYRAGGTDVPVVDGGTGLSCLTTGSVLIGTGTSDVTLVAMVTKGHLLAGDGSGAPRALAVGSNCQVLTACSGETTGIKWAAAAGGHSDKFFSGSGGSNQSLTNGAFAPVVLSAERQDIGCGHSACATTVSFATAGTYVITGSVLFAGNSCGARNLMLRRLNSSDVCQGYFARTDFDAVSTTGNHHSQVTGIEKFAACDKVQMIARQTSGGALNILYCGITGINLHAVLVYEC